MSDYLPGLGPVRSMETAPRGSLRDASRPWAALGGVGEQIADQGDRLASIYSQQKNMEAQRELVKMQMEYEKISQDYEMQMLQNPNITPEEATQGWQMATKDFAQKYNSPDMSPMMRDVVGTRSQQLLNKGGFNVAKTATLAFIQNSKQEYLNGLQTALNTGNPDLADLSMQGLRSIMPESEVDKLQMTFNRDYALNQAENWVTEDAFTARHMLYEDPERFFQEHPDVPRDQLQRLRSASDTHSKRSIGAAYDTFYDKIAENKIRSAEDIKLQFGDYPPRVVDDMIANFNKANSEKEINFYKTPEGAKYGEARILKLLDGMETTGGDEYYRMMGEARHIQSMLDKSPIKEYTGIRLQESAKNRESDTSDAMSVVGKQIENMRIPGSLTGKPIPKPEPMRITEELRAGLLKDPKKLTALGYDEGMQEKIAGAKNETERRRLFQYYWKNAEKNQAKELSPGLKALGEAIWKGSETADWIDPDQLREYNEQELRDSGIKANMLKQAMEAFKKDPTLSPIDLMDAAMGGLDDPENNALSNDILGE